MTTASAPSPRTVFLHAAQRGGPARLVPEQEATFDLTLKNDTADPQTLASLDGNQFTPIVRAFDAQNKKILEAGPETRRERVVGHRGPTEPPETVTQTLVPGGTEVLWVNLWKFTDPLPKGTYSFEATHLTSDSAPQALTSNRVPFEITDARVISIASGYESASRMASLLAWVAAPPGGNPRLLARLSAFSDHSRLQQGGTLISEVPAEARIAISQALEANWTGWFAVVEKNTAELFHHNMTHSGYRTGKIPLGIDDATPVPRFPDRNHGLFLATGRTATGSALAGFTAEEGGPVGHPWVTPISQPAILSACTFGENGPISILYVSDDGSTSRFFRLDVDPTGAVKLADHVIRQSPNKVLALVADIRPDAHPSFFALEVNRTVPDRLALIHLPLNGAAKITPFAPAPGWPTTTEAAGPRPLRPEAVDLEVAADGSPLLAVIDELGGFSAGKLDGTPFHLVHEARLGRAHHPQIAAFAKQINVGAFNEQGALFVSGL